MSHTEDYAEASSREEIDYSLTKEIILSGITVEEAIALHKFEEENGNPDVVYCSNGEMVTVDQSIAISFEIERWIDSSN